MPLVFFQKINKLWYVIVDLINLIVDLKNPEVFHVCLLFFSLSGTRAYTSEILSTKSFLYLKIKIETPLIQFF